MVASVARRAGWEVAGFLDDGRPQGEPFAGARVLGGLALAAGHPGPLFLAIGDCARRAVLYRSLAGHRFPALVDPASILADDVTPGPGSVVRAGAILGPGSLVGANCIVNTGALLEASCRLHDHSHVCPGTILGAGAEVGEASMVGTGALLLPSVRVGARCLVAAGAVLRHDLPDDARWLGRSAAEVADPGALAPQAHDIRGSAPPSR